MTALQVIKLIISLQKLLGALMDAVVEKSKAEDKRELLLAIEEAKNAKTTDEKILAARRIADSFRSRSSKL